MAPQKSFEDAAKDFGLKDATIKILLENDIDSTTVLAAISSADIESLRLSLGQSRLLGAWLKKLNTKRGASSKPQDKSAIEQSEQASLITTDTLAQNPSLAADVQRYMEDGNKLTDLLGDMKGDNTTGQPGASTIGKKPLLIPDFIVNTRNSCEDEEEIEVVSGGKTSLYAKATKSLTKPRPEDVTMAQWIGANSRIQSELTRRGDIASRSAQLKYQRYTSQIGDWAQSYTWTSMMLFDNAFRKKQANEGLQWDDMNNIWGLAFLYLEKRPFKQSTSQRKPNPSLSNSVGPRMRDSNGQQICLKYNSTAGCTFAACKYSHCCLQPGCQGRHPQHQHTSQ